MKKSIIFLFISLFFFCAYSQNVGIGTTSPNASAKLDISATDKGLLIPRINLTALASAAPITSPATGLLVYNTNAALSSGEGFYYWNGTSWIKFSTSAATNFIQNQNVAAQSANFWINGSLHGATAQVDALGGGGTKMVIVDNLGNLSTQALPTDAQTLSYVPATGVLSISGGNTVTIPVSTGDITDVVAGGGLTGGATSGSATLDIGAGSGITVNANDIAVKYDNASIGLNGTGQLEVKNYLPTTRTLTVNGSANQITVSPTGAQDLSANRTWTISTPQDIHAAATPTFSDLTLSANNVNGGVVYTTATGNLNTSAAGTSGQILQSNGAAAPSWINSSAILGTDTDANDGMTVNYPDIDIKVGNGLSIANDSVQLGGSLTKTTTITQGNFNLINDLTGTGNFEVRKAGATDLFVSGTNGRVGISTATPTTGLHLISDEGSLAEGTLGNGTALNLGAGTRMWFYPKKAAFRVGNVTGTQWNDSLVGNYSTAMGLNTTARGGQSTAMGSGTIASGLRSTSMGSNTTASGSNATAMGSSTNASGSNTTAMGANTNASGNNATAIGLNVTASAFGETAIGTYNTLATAPTATSWVATDRLFTIGNGSAAASPSDAMVVLKNGNIGMGTSLPDASAKLDISATNKGLLIPRVSLTALASAAPITSPATGLQVYNTNATLSSGEGFYYWNGISWVKFSTSDAQTLSYVPATGVLSISGGNTVTIPVSTGDITDVVAGGGLTGGATSGSATLDIGAGSGITVNANDIAVKYDNASIGLNGTGQLEVKNYLPTTRTLTVNGSANQITVSPTGAQDLSANRTWTISTPQDIHAAATPTFSDLTLSSNNVNGGVVYTTATGNLNTSAAGTSGQILQSNGAAAPSWINSSAILGTDTDANDGMTVSYPDIDIKLGNGLSIVNDSVQLGGALTKTTTITQGNFSLINDLTGIGNFEVRKSGATDLFVSGTNGRVGIGTATPTTGLHLISDEGSLAEGTLGNGTALNLGAGTRMWFYPKKAAFRVGNVTGTQWNDSLVGNYSTAMGLNTTARGGQSTAFGFGTIASGIRATAMGGSTIASGSRSTAMGASTTASGDYATSMGNTTRASGYASLALGYITTASGNYTVAMGDSTTASGNNAVAMGANTTASAYLSTAMGGNTIASGDFATAMGVSSTASGESSFVVGSNALASGYASIAMGDYTSATGNYATAIGSQTTASGVVSNATGKLTTASGDYSTTMGRNTSATAYVETVIGQYNTLAITPNATNWVATDRIFTIGNGFIARSDAMVVLKNGNVGIGNSTPTDRLVVYNGTTTGTYTAAGWVHSSDKRLKTNVAGITNALSIVSQLNGVYYDWKGNAEAGRQVGFIAQDVKAVLPEVVSGKEGDIEKGEILGVSYGAVVPVLVEAIKELKAENEALIKRINHLEKELSAPKGQ